MATAFSPICRFREWSKYAAITCGIFLTFLPTKTRAEYVNLSFTGTSAWSSTITIPPSSSPRLFPDGVTRVPSDFVFKAGTNSTWNLDAGAVVTLRQDWPYIYNRFFIGTGDGTESTLTFTTGTLLNPGKLNARLDSTVSMRLGETASNSKGTLRIDGGVEVQTGYIYGEGPSPALQIVNGRFDVFSSNKSKRLNGINITFGPKGKLWIEDPSNTVTNLDSLLAFTNAASITAPGGRLVFQNNVDGYPLWGAVVSGVLVSVDSSLDSDKDGLPDAWEIAGQLDPFDDGSINIRNGPAGDPDNDGSTNLQEFQRGTNPAVADTDHDGLLDGVETGTGIFVSPTDTGTSPLSTDSDMDGVADGVEIAQETDPTDGDDPGIIADRDQDGLPDDWEIAHHLDPDDDGSINPANGPDGDPDIDGVPNSEEYLLDTDPMVNESGFAWQPRPAKAGILAVAAHPDDEGIFFGGTIPYYAKVKQLPTILVSMTSGDYNSAPPVREQQLRAAAWAYGLRNQPLFPRFRDFPATLENTWDLWANGVIDGNDAAAGRLKASLYIAKIIRRYRPEVIVTHGATGEYGHNDHIATSQAVVDAWALASDPNVEIEGLPPWQPKKLYLHEWTSHRLFHDFWETAYPSLNGKTPRAVTLAGLQYHYNQSNSSTVYAIGEVKAEWDAHPSEWWGLYNSTVGWDTVVPDFTVAGTNYSGWAKGDFLEHVTIPTAPPPLIINQKSQVVSYPWNATMSPKISTDAPASAQSFVWSLVSGPGTVDFQPSAFVKNPTLGFSNSGQYTIQLTASDGNSNATRLVTVYALPRPSTNVLAIHCGGQQYVGRNGIVWQQDTYFTGGQSTSTPSLRIAATKDDPLFQTQRTGNCSYAIPTPNGKYDVTLRFAETAKNRSFLRRFNVDLENTRVETSLDPFSVAGYARAFDRTYAVTVADGVLTLQLSGEVDKPAIAAILVRATDADPPRTTSGGLITEGGSGTSGSTTPSFPTPPALTLDASTRTVRFQARVTEGDAYVGRLTRYRVEVSPDLQPGSWTPLWEGTADDTWKEVHLHDGLSSEFVRLALIIE